MPAQTATETKASETVIAEFDTSNTTYRIYMTSLERFRVTRQPSSVYTPPEGLTLAHIQEFEADKIVCVPTSKYGSVLEQRRVVFTLKGEWVLSTSSCHSNAYNALPWGEYADDPMAEVW